MLSEVEEVYGELRKVAAIHLSRSVSRPSLQPTQLVHEVWVRLAGRGWKSKTHFLALASRAMRTVIIDAIRARLAVKRGGDWHRAEVPPGVEIASPAMSLSADQVIDLDRALEQLAAEDFRKAQVVEMHFFGGMEFKEISEALEVSMSTVKRDWQFSRAWLYTRLAPREGSHLSEN
ncbi:MAG: sigma-70 family RNA polymerase sigma factor [Acidobacteria bacterium]|nr:sigma-70 family RNA polymerase sigma factor [Acidobacteriota bacterium]